MFHIKHKEILIFVSEVATNQKCQHNTTLFFYSQLPRSENVIQWVLQIYCDITVWK